MKAILTIEGDVRDAGKLAALIEALCRAEGGPEPSKRTYSDGKRVDVGRLRFEEVPADEVPEAADDAPEAADDVPEAAAPEVTVDDVRAAMVAAIDEGRRNDVMAVLKAHGAASLTDLGEADYPAVVAELGAM